MQDTLLGEATNYRTDIVNFLGGAYWRGALISKILLFGGALIRSFTVLKEFKRDSYHAFEVHSIGPNIKNIEYCSCDWG